MCSRHWEEHKSNRGKALRDKTLQEYWDSPALTNLPESSRNVRVRDFARRDFRHLAKLPCACCGYSLHVEIAHKKAVSEFPPTAKISEVNAPNNVVQLCPNCHWEYDNLPNKNIFDL